MTIDERAGVGIHEPTTEKGKRDEPTRGDTSPLIGKGHTRENKSVGFDPLDTVRP